ncbi:hypothetical protein, partial [Actinomadura sp. LOL_011]|uniref:hypothetical protein n=1 Tax=Actinomadura sp. LOL_011 TaxID=3345410 RepID=UPI003A7F6E8A
MLPTAVRAGQVPRGTTTVSDLVAAARPYLRPDLPGIGEAGAQGLGGREVRHQRHAPPVEVRGAVQGGLPGGEGFGDQVTFARAGRDQMPGRLLTDTRPVLRAHRWTDPPAVGRSVIVPVSVAVCVSSIVGGVGAQPDRQRQQAALA